MADLQRLVIQEICHKEAVINADRNITLATPQLLNVGQHNPVGFEAGLRFSVRLAPQKLQSIQRTFVV
jgi:hypothetical protein